MKFRVGDVVEVIGCHQESSRKHLGKVGAIARIWPSAFDGRPIHRLEGEKEELNGFGHPYGWDSGHLRLLRPPSWDKWLYSTDDVKDEQRDGVEA